MFPIITVSILTNLINLKVTPPTMLDPVTTIEDGQVQTEIKWEHSMNFKERELTKQWYSVILNNMSSVDTEGEVLDYHVLQMEENQTSLMVNLSMAEGWDTTFSVVTHLGDVDSAATDPTRLFPDSARPGPPQQVLGHPHHLDSCLQIPFSSGDHPT